MTLKEFITGSVKILGLVILLYGALNTASSILAAGSIYYTNHMVQSDMAAASTDAEFEAQLNRQMRAAEMKSRGDVQLLRIPLALIQIGFGLYLCRREQRIVRFLLN